MNELPEKEFLKNNITENISIGIFGTKSKKNLELKLSLQCYGFFVKIIENSQEVLFSIEDNLIQLLLISSEAISTDKKREETFRLCECIRKKFIVYDFPIIFLLNETSSHLAGKICELKINDFLFEPFEPSALLSKIQILDEYKKLYFEKQEFLKSEREKSVLLYSVTHNVNIPLTILLNDIQKLSLTQNFSFNPENDKNAKEKSDSIKNILESAREINLIIQNALNSYKISDGRYIALKKIINLKEFLESENTFLSRKAELKNQKFDFECYVKNPRVFCDENSLKGIYVNLVDNAIKYTNPGGNITVIVSEDRNFLYLSVIDDGLGIPQEKRHHLFERFAQIGTKPTGKENSCGLGLYVVNEICKLNDISLEYSENTNAKSGSIFTAKFTKIG